MKKLLLVAFLTSAFNSLYAADAPATGEIRCDPNDERCCERIANGGRATGTGDDTPAPSAPPAGSNTTQ
ncbi:MAG: hypothetical protein Fur0010_22720 [Bdellovibrio sp.]